MTVPKQGVNKLSDSELMFVPPQAVNKLSESELLIASTQAVSKLSDSELMFVPTQAVGKLSDSELMFVPTQAVSKLSDSELMFVPTQAVSKLSESEILAVDTQVVNVLGADTQAVDVLGADTQAVDVLAAESEAVDGLAPDTEAVDVTAAATPGAGNVGSITINAENKTEDTTSQLGKGTVEDSVFEVEDNFDDSDLMLAATQEPFTTERTRVVDKTEAPTVILAQPGNIDDLENGSDNPSLCNLSYVSLVPGTQEETEDYQNPVEEDEIGMSQNLLEDLSDGEYDSLENDEEDEHNAEDISGAEAESTRITELNEKAEHGDDTEHVAPPENEAATENEATTKNEAATEQEAQTEQEATAEQEAPTDKEAPSKQEAQTEQEALTDYEAETEEEAATEQEAADKQETTIEHDTKESNETSIEGVVEEDEAEHDCIDLKPGTITHSDSLIKSQDKLDLTKLIDEVEIRAVINTSGIKTSIAEGSNVETAPVLIKQDSDMIIATSQEASEPSSRRILNRTNYAALSMEQTIMLNKTHPSGSHTTLPGENKITEISEINKNIESCEDIIPKLDKQDSNMIISSSQDSLPRKVAGVRGVLLETNYAALSMEQTTMVATDIVFANSQGSHGSILKTPRSKNPKIRSVNPSPVQEETNSPIICKSQSVENRSLRLCLESSDLDSPIISKSSRSGSVASKLFDSLGIGSDDEDVDDSVVEPEKEKDVLPIVSKSNHSVPLKSDSLIVAKTPVQPKNAQIVETPQRVRNSPSCQEKPDSGPLLPETQELVGRLLPGIKSIDKSEPSEDGIKPSKAENEEELGRGRRARRSTKKILENDPEPKSSYKNSLTTDKGSRGRKGKLQPKTDEDMEHGKTSPEASLSKPADIKKASRRSRAVLVQETDPNPGQTEVDTKLKENIPETSISEPAPDKKTFRRSLAVLDLESSPNPEPRNRRRKPRPSIVINSSEREGLIIQEEFFKEKPASKTDLESTKSVLNIDEESRDSEILFPGGKI